MQARAVKVIKHFVSCSGGKDSTATLLLARERGVDVTAVFADTGNEHELTYEYLEYLERALGMSIVRLRVDFTERIADRRMFVARDQRKGRKYTKVQKVDSHGRKLWKTNPDGSFVTVEDEDGKAVRVPIMGFDGGKKVRHSNKAKRRVLAALQPTGNPYLDLCLWKGRFPSRTTQFCTQFLKTEPLVEYMMGFLDQGYEVWSWQGVRADESPGRANLLELEDVGGGLWNHRPIHKWNIDQVFDIHRRHGIKPNPLYLMGMSRVGCMPCINASKGEVLAISQRFPGHIERIALWESQVGAVAKRNDGASFFPDPHRSKGLDKRGIYKMVEWSKTSRGGKQYMLAGLDDEPGQCSSSYGLCE